MSTTSAPAAAVAAVAAAAASGAPKPALSLHSDAPSLEAIYGDAGPAPSTMSDPFPSRTPASGYRPPQPLASHLSGPMPKSEMTDGRLERRISISSSVAARSPNHAAMVRHPFLQGLDTLASAASAAASPAVSDPVPSQLGPAAPLTTRRPIMPEYSAPNALAAASSCSSGLAAALASREAMAPAPGKAQFPARMVPEEQRRGEGADGALQPLPPSAPAEMTAALGEPENSMEQSLRQLMEQPSLPRHNGPPPPLFAPSVPSGLASGMSNRTAHVSAAAGAVSQEPAGDAVSAGAHIGTGSMRDLVQAPCTIEAKGDAPGILDNWDPLMQPMLGSTNEGSGEHPDPGIAPHMRLPPRQPQLPPIPEARRAAAPQSKGDARLPCAQKPQATESALSAEETRTAPAASGVGASSVCQDAPVEMFGAHVEV